MRTNKKITRERQKPTTKASKKKQWQFISGPFLQMLQLKETLWVDLAAE